MSEGKAVWINSEGPFTASAYRERVEALDVTSALPTYRPDPAWRFVDDAGHLHAYSADGQTPTLRAHPACERPGCEDCESVNRCWICEQVVMPGVALSQPGGVRQSTPGARHWEIDVPVPADVLLRLAAVSDVTVNTRGWFAVARVVAMCQWGDRGEITVAGGEQHKFL